MSGQRTGWGLPAQLGSQRPSGLRMLQLAVQRRFALHDTRGNSSFTSSVFCSISKWKLVDFSETVVFQEEPVEPGSYPRAPLVDEGVAPLNKDQQRQDGLSCWTMHSGQTTPSAVCWCQDSMMDWFSCFSLQPPEDSSCSQGVPLGLCRNKEVCLNLITKSLHLLCLVQSQTDYFFVHYFLHEFNNVRICSIYCSH